MNELQQETSRAIVNIFETGRIRGNYAAITVIAGDSGHLSYGRSQSALGSGTLYKLLESYCQQQNAKYAAELRPFLPRFQQKDVTLDTDTEVRRLLKAAGTQDPVMRATQDQFFNRQYFAPACSAAETLGILEPLGQTVIYDSHIQGGWGTLKARMGPVSPGRAREWVKKYVELRTTWLKSLRPPLPNTIYRMNAFQSLMAAEKWNLELPLTVHGTTITEDGLRGDNAEPSQPRRVLTLTMPYLRGEDVKQLQTALVGKGLPASQDGVYGPFTSQLVAEWQRRQLIDEVGVREATRLSLGIG